MSIFALLICSLLSKIAPWLHGTMLGETGDARLDKSWSWEGYWDNLWTASKLNIFCCWESHITGRTLMLISPSIWFFVSYWIPFIWKKILSQIVHWCGFSPVWIFSCLFKWFFASERHITNWKVVYISHSMYPLVSY